MKRILLLYVVYLMGIPLNASEFKNFKVNEDRLSQLFEKKSSNIKNHSLSSRSSSKKINILFHQNSNSSHQLKKFSSKDSVSQNFEFSNSPIYDQVVDFMSNNYLTLGQELSGNILTHNRNFNLGTKNTPGFTWQKLLGSISVIADRQVTPSLTQDLWVVQDQLLISVNAKTFLQSLSEKGALNISNASLGAFAGLSFNRKYTFNHTASSYEDGLKSDFKKLFLAPVIFHGVLYDQIKKEESLEKEDFFSLHAGGHLSVPLQYGLELSAAFIGGVERLSQIQMKKKYDIFSNNDEYSFSLHFKKQKKTFSGIELGLALDFLNLLKLTLLKFEYRYDHQISDTKSYDIPLNYLNQFKLGGEEHRDLIQVVNYNKEHNQILKSYFSYHEYRSKKSRHKKFSLFVWGNQSSFSEEERVLTTNNESIHYFTHSGTSSNYLSSFKNALQSQVSLSVLGFDLFKTYKKRDLHNYSFTYNYKNSFEEQKIEMAHQYYIKKSTGRKAKYLKQHIIRKLKTTGFSDKEVYSDIHQDKIRAPLMVDVKYLLDDFALSHFKRKEINEVANNFSQVCEPNYDNEYEELFSRYGNECIDNFVYLFKKVKKGNQKSISSFNKILKNLYEMEVSIQFLRILFGGENVAGLIQIKGQTQEGQPYTYFRKSGEITNTLSYTLSD